MASGKQLSFQYGEVATSQRFKSNAVSYSEALYKLRNMYVRADGGVSNRAGLQFVRKALSQANIPARGGSPGIKGFTYWDPFTNKWKMIEYAYYAAGGEYGFLINEVDDQTPSTTPIYNSYGNANTGPTPDKIRFTTIKDYVFISPEMTETVVPAQKANVALDIENQLIEPNFAVGYSQLGFSAFVLAATGVAPDLPVSYYLTIIAADGTENYLADIVSATAHPHSSKVSKLTATINPTYWTKVKYIQIYRASGNAGIGKSFYKLVGRVPYAQGQTAFEFHDYGVEDASNTPPLDTSFRTGILSGVECASYYQQRLIMGMRPGTTSTVKSGDVVASKLGAVQQISAPVIYNNTGAFQFSVPLTDGTPVYALLAMERLLAFTARGVHAIRGGEQGILTPTTVNPLTVSAEGCSKLVEPKMSGRRGFFVNNTHTKLMGIEFGSDANMSVYDASKLSNHLLKQDVVQIEAISGSEDIIYLLRRDGTLVSVTINEEGAHGFATVDTQGGYIESIFTSKARRPFSPNYTQELARDAFYDVLMCYVIRNGIRSLERIVVRDDSSFEGEFFADCFKSTGFRLSMDGDNGWRRINNLDSISTFLQDLGSNFKLNIPAQDFTAGAGKVLHYVNPDEVPLPGDDNMIVYKYSGGQVLIEVVPGSEVASGDVDFPWAITCVFHQDIPAELQNVKGQAGLTASQKNYLYTSWTPGLRYINFNTGTDHADILGVSSLPELSVIADGIILSSPLNPNRGTLLLETYAGGHRIDMGDYYTFAVAGLPITSEFETLDIESGDNRTLTDSNKVINSVGVGLMETRGGFFGVPGKELTEMEELVLRTDGNIAAPVQNMTGYKLVPIPSEWTQGGRIAIKNVDPVPMTILSVYPNGIAGD